MFAPHEQKKLPRYVYLKEETAEHYARSTLKGNYNLLPFENFWRDRQRFLSDHGYILRPRYWPNWKPSWLGTTLRPAFCEDSIVLVVRFSIRAPTVRRTIADFYRPVQDSQVIDAKKREGKDLVAIKKFHKDSQELQISQFLSSSQDPQNHSITVFEVLNDPFDPGLALMVMPYLRPCNDPDFGTVGDMILFVSETLEVRPIPCSFPRWVLIYRRDLLSCIGTASLIGSAHMRQPAPVFSLTLPTATSQWRTS